MEDWRRQKKRRGEAKGGGERGMMGREEEWKKQEDRNGRLAIRKTSGREKGQRDEEDGGDKCMMGRKECKSGRELEENK